MSNQIKAKRTSDAKIIRFEATSKQDLAWQYLNDDLTTEIGYGGGGYGGKSFLGCFWILKNCMCYPDTRWFIARHELKNLRLTTLKTFFKLCAIFGIKEGLYFNYNKQDNVITFYNKSEIILLDLAYKPSDPLYTRF